MTDPKDVPIACDLNALSAAERTRRGELALRVRSRIAGVSELPDGYALLLAQDPDVYRDSLELCLLERRCCPFLELSLRLEPGGGPVSLRITGPSGVKTFLAESGILATPAAARFAC